MDKSNSGFSEAGLRKIRDVLTRHVDSGKIPGVVALIGRGEQTHVEAIGTMRHDGGAPMSRDTIFRMASTSKPVTMAASMALLDDCRLRLDDPVDQWLPELADRQVLKRIDGPIDDTEPARRPITVRDLLTSTFGLGIDLTAVGSPIFNAIFANGVFSQGAVPLPEQDEWMRRLGTLPLMRQPGEHWQYHLSHDVLGVLVSRVTGRPFETFLRERVLDPLGMKDTAFHVPADKIDRLPPSYAPDPQTGEFTVWDEAKTGQYSAPPAFQAGGGGLVSTVDDYHAYFRMLLDHGMHGTERILSRPAHLPRRLRAPRPVRLGRRNRHLGLRRPGERDHRHPAHAGRTDDCGSGAAHPRLLDHGLPGGRRLTRGPGRQRRMTPASSAYSPSTTTLTAAAANTFAACSMLPRRWRGVESEMAVAPLGRPP
ncbi:serine hydrolase domain-containing protein [Streptomyces lavendulae]|uniref:serine hydrolase domain-containing protein n=2 Tax=Streptomyces TaxID=1883 RepID=UPI000AE6BBB6